MVVKKLFQDVSLGEIFYINTKSINPGNTPNKKFWHYSIPAYDDNKEPTLDRGADIKSNKYLLETDSILVSKLNPRIKRVWKFQKSDRHEPSICSTEFIVYQPKIPNVDLEYYTQFFSSDIFQNKLLSLQNGTTGSRMRVTPSDTLSIPIPFPSINEQRKIAAILSSVDEAIEKTEAIIEQTEKVKKGLMQQLLTKGIGHTKFKKTEIGEIPEEWEVVQLGEKKYTQKITQGPNPKYNIGRLSDEYRVLKTKDLYDHEILYDQADLISKETFESCISSELKDRDILVAIVGKGSIGKSNIFYEQKGRKYIFTRAIGLIRVNKDTIYPEYLHQFFQSERGKKIFEKGINGSTGQEVLQTSYLKEVKIPLPPLTEQIEIVKRLEILDKKIRIENNKLNALNNMKKSLMQSLLTGKVRVKVDEDEVMSS
jgi:type I restriction enzyme S subunit